jgi:hypothetical protein
MQYSEVFDNMQKFSKAYNDYIDVVRKRSNQKKIKEFADMRGFQLSTVEELGIFYVGDPVEMLVPKYLDLVEAFGVISPTNKKPIFHDRYVIPIKDVYGNMLNVVGYQKDANERYVYGTSVYYRRRDHLWGLENMHKAYEKGYGILVEGITDAIALRDIGYDVTFANCGTHGAPMAMRQFDRCRYGLLEIPDRDPAGQSAASRWKCHRFITLNTFVEYKDIDEMIHKGENGRQWVKSYIDNCIEWLKLKEHQGFDCERPVVTMY